MQNTKRKTQNTKYKTIYKIKINKSKKIISLNIFFS